jgi:hypothetical protein
MLSVNDVKKLPNMPGAFLLWISCLRVVQNFIPVMQIEALRLRIMLK